MPIKWTRQHVKGHQDREIKYKDLDPWAKANVRADHLAEDMRNRMQRMDERPAPNRMPGEGWRVIIDGRTLRQDVDEAIYEHRYREKCIAYWKRKGRINKGQDQEIDWEAYGKAAKMMPRAKTQWTHKHFLGFEANNYMLHKFGKRNDPICPQCDQVERYNHTLRCTAIQAKKTYKKVQQSYADWLENTTDPYIGQAIIKVLQATREGRPAKVQELWPDDVRQLVNQQQRVGGISFAEGRIHRQWEGIQAKYLEKMHSRRSPRRWVIQLIQKTWMVSWDMWDQRNDMVHNHKDTKLEQITAALHAEIRNIHNFGRTHRFLPRVAKRFFKQPIEEILKMTN